MNESQPGASMRLLPRRNASPAFTSEVMRRIRRERKAEPRRSFAWRMAAAVAMAAFIVAAINIAIIRNDRRERIATMRAEQQKIAAELAAVKKVADETEPVVVLENDKGTRVIIDLDSAPRPASPQDYD